MDGIILVNKEKGISSFGVVAKIRKIFNTKKVGHCGTLDPEACGVLPIMVGQATKISKYLVEHDKEYISVLKLGIKTDSADMEGNIIEKTDFHINKGNEALYREQILKMIGKSKQVPPMYSAIKVDGKKLYEYAREGKEIERKPRDIEIYELEILNFNYEENEIKFRVKCSKGTYIRTLCEDIALKLGTVGYMKELQRTKVDNFCIENSYLIDDLEKIENKDEIMISIEDLFSDKPRIDLNERKKELFLNGVMMTYNLEDNLYRVYSNNVFMGLGIIKNELLKRDVII